MNDYITPEREHSALLIIDVQRDFTVMGATAEIPVHYRLYITFSV
jgi:hypothetical protein